MKLIGKTLIVVLALLSSSSLRATTREKNAVANPRGAIANTLMKQMVDLTNQALREWDPKRSRFIGDRNAENSSVLDTCYLLAFLYKTPSPLNPYYGIASTRDDAIAIADRIVAADADFHNEWPLYWLDQTYALLKPEIPPQTAEAWKAYVADYVATRGRRPFFYTAPNHESWNAMAIYRAGQVFGEEQWMALGAGLMHELIKEQTALGYFDEGPGHGPSMKYNSVQLTAMMLYYKFSNDPVAFAASEKLASFMIRYSYPDGSPIATFDGRQNYWIGYDGTLCYGLDRWPLGSELIQRIYRTRQEWGMLDVQSPQYNLSEWYADFGSQFLVDEYRSLRDSALPAPLPQDKDGYRAADNGPTFHGGVAREHGWMVALSAINSDIPRYSPSIYQLERQSRIGIWNEKTGLIIGGGSSMVGAKMPLANFELLTGFKDVSSNFGTLSGGSERDRQAVYFPTALKFAFGPYRQSLEASFAQGDLSVEIAPVSESQLELHYRYHLLAAKQALIQLPVVLFYNSKVQVDGKTFDGQSAMKVAHRVVIENPTTHSTVTITVPPGSDVLLNRPVYPLRWYTDDDNYEKNRYTPFYRIALLSLSLNPQESQGGGKFLIEIE
ncbi:MAG: hypothetical protein ACRD28_03075 [Acidobacteriaceae bacterium]